MGGTALWTMSRFTLGNMPRRVRSLSCVKRVLGARWAPLFAPYGASVFPLIGVPITLESKPRKVRSPFSWESSKSIAFRR